jgi:pimeloyl-[acyl-carrier protein] methyl ester esterase
MSVRVRILALSTLALVALGARPVSTPVAPAASGLGHGPPIVIVPGLGSSSAHWMPVARRLAASHRVLFVDLPGQGASAMPEPFSLDRAAQELDRAVTRSTHEPVILVGHSLGGLVAAAEACQRPGRVRGLVLVETALCPRVTPEERRTAFAALDRDYDGVLRAAYSDFGRDSAQGAALYRGVSAEDPAMVKRWIRLALTADLSGRIARLRCPLLVVLAPRSWHKGEPWVEAAAALGYGAAPRERAVRLDGCGHFVMLDRPDDLARLIERFAAAPQGGPVVLRPTPETGRAG